MSQFYSKTQEMGGWEKWHELQERAQEPVTDWYVRATRVAPGQSLVDVACGTGIPALALAARAGASRTLVAVDTSASMLATLGRKAAARSLGNIETRETTAAVIGGPDAAFDVVTC